MTAASAGSRAASDAPGAAGVARCADADGVERWIARTDSRAVAIALVGGARCLVSVVPAGVEELVGLRDPREPWDLPLVDLRAAGDGLAAIVEALLDGEPAVGDAPAAGEISVGGSAAGGPAGAPPGSLRPFVVELLTRVAATHAAGALVGPLHPALVFVTADGHLAGTGQRVLRAPLRAVPEGRAPLFETPFVTPSEVRGEADQPADDVFRLAAMAWAWRWGEPPFGTGPASVLALVAGRLLRDPADDLDRLLAAALAPEPAARPSAAEIAAALRDPA